MTTDYTTRRDTAVAETLAAIDEAVADWTSGTYRRPGSDPVSTVDATWDTPDMAQAAQAALADRDLTPWQQDVLRAAYTPGPDGLPRYTRVTVPPSRRHGLALLFRRLTRRDR